MKFRSGRGEEEIDYRMWNKEVSQIRKEVRVKLGGGQRGRERLKERKRESEKPFL